MAGDESVRRGLADYVPLALLSLVAGAATGAVGAEFRLALDAAGRLRDQLVARAHDGPPGGLPLIMAVCGTACLVAAWLVRRWSPFAGGSGIPHVEAVLRDGIAPASWTLAPVKFVGGVLGIGGGLALGREGPMVQMGSSLAHLIGVVLRRPWPESRALLAAGAGAGLATAFNAPLAGAAFVLEEVLQTFDPRITVATLTASATAISVSRVILGDSRDFQVGPLPNVPFEAHPIFFVFGLAVGLVAVVYNKAILGAIALVGRIPLPVEARAGLIGMAVGALAFAWPGAVGGGDPITQALLTGGPDWTLVAVILAVRFVLGPISYAAGTPGGLFAPLLVIGAAAGSLFGTGCDWAFPGLGVPTQSFAVVGMAAFFTGTVRSPLTGLVLVTEMTGNVTLLLPGLEASAFAMLAAEALRNGPIYDSLREALLRRVRAG